MDAALSNALFSGARSGAQLRELLGVSQPTLSRMLQRSRSEIAVLGRGRATRYGLYRRIRELEPELPVFRISRAGEIERIATIVAIAPSRFWFNDLQDPAQSREFLSLPWFITDMRPQGFLGRLFPLRYDDLELPDRIVDWNEDHALYAMARRGEELAGNLLIGQESHARWLTLARGTNLIREQDRLRKYAELARSTLEGRSAGSSAAGEQPKFTAEIGESANSFRHVIVKFSPQLDTANGRRWSDLLVAEQIASEILREHHFEAARSAYFADADRAYLEVERFDRVGTSGRLGLVSLGALDDEFVGERLNWPKSAAGLLRARLIDADDAQRLRWLSAFGSLIANTDMHLGNASFLYEGRLRFRLAPAYDMLPMFYAPVRDEIADRTFTVPAPTSAAADQWRLALPAARAFWDALSTDTRATSEFRVIARANAVLLAASEFPQ